MLIRFSATIGCIVLLTLSTAIATGATVTSAQTGDNPYHVFEPGKPFSFTLILGAGSSGVTGYQWVDWNGQKIGPPRPSDGLSFTVQSPDPAQMTPGYYGLRLLPAGTVIELGSRAELGFAVLPKYSGPISSRSPFGMVHADIADPYLKFAWTKTTWSQPVWKWDPKTEVGTIDSKTWQQMQGNVIAHGRTDLPLMVGTPWETTPSDLAGIAEMAAAFLKSTPTVPAWEWGREEAHVSWDLKTAQDYYNAVAGKFQAVRREADDNGAAKTLLVHQLEGVLESDPTRMPAVQAFFGGPAVAYVDILSLHPYPWPDFQSPDLWLEPFLKTVNSYRASSSKPNIPIWMTEIGCVNDDAGLVPGKMEDGNSPITGLSRAGAATFLVKLHTIAFANGVSRIYWYHYSDWDGSTTNGESHFGMRDFWGYPKPQYAAYATMVNLISDKKFAGENMLANNIHVCRFGAQGDACFVAWDASNPSRPVNVAIRTLIGRLRATSISDTVGHPIDPTKGEIAIDGDPIFICATPR